MENKRVDELIDLFSLNKFEEAINKSEELLKIDKDSEIAYEVKTRSLFKLGYFK